MPDNTIDSEQLYVQFVSHFLGNHNAATPYDINQCGCVRRFQDQSTAQEANKAQIDIIDRLEKELVNEQSIEVNKDDTGLNYYYTIKSVEWAIERIRNQLTAEKGKA